MNCSRALVAVNARTQHAATEGKVVYYGDLLTSAARQRSDYLLWQVASKASLQMAFGLSYRQTTNVL